MDTKFGLCPIHEAIKNGFTDTVELLIESGVDINCRDSKGSTSLIVACKHGRKEIAKILLANKEIDINAKNSYHKRAIYVACENKHFDIAHAILDKADELRKELVIRQERRLEKTGWSGYWEVSEDVVDITGICGDNFMNNNILEYCRENKEIFERVLKLYNTTALRWYHSHVSDRRDSIPESIISDGMKDAIRYCSEFDDLDKVLELANRRYKNEVMLIHIACYQHKINAVEDLLNTGISPNVKDNNGRTPLHYVTMCKGSKVADIIQLLLKRGANINCMSKEGNTPLHSLIKIYKANYFERHNILDVIDLVLCVPEIDVNITDQKGRSQFFYACYTGDTELVERLLDVGGIPFPNSDDEYIRAASNGKISLLEVLYERNELENSRISDEGNSILDHVINESSESDECIAKIKFLAERGFGEITLKKDGLATDVMLSAIRGSYNWKIFRYLMENIFSSAEVKTLYKLAKDVGATNDVLYYISRCTKF